MFEEYPDILNVDEACELLRIGRNNFYKLLKADNGKGENKQIHIRYESCDDGPAYNLYPASTPRSISLPSYLFGELADLYEAQRDTMAKYQLEAQTNAVASTVKGFHIPPWLLEFFFTQLLAVCKLPKYSFSILCDTWDYQCRCGIDNPAPYADDSRERQLFTYVYSKMKEVWH